MRRGDTSAAPALLTPALTERSGLVADHQITSRDYDTGV
jgi:hypothetical protein